MTFKLTTKDKYYPLLQELTYIRPLRMLSPASFWSGPTTSPTTENSCHAGWGKITGLGETITCMGLKQDSAFGTGPWKYDGTQANGDAHFSRNTDHWFGSPQVEKIVVKKYADAAAVNKALLDGTLDAVVGAGVLA